MLSIVLYLFAGALLVAAAVVALVSSLVGRRADRSVRDALTRQGIEIVSPTFAEKLVLRSSDGIEARRLTPFTLGSATPVSTPELQHCSVAEMSLREPDLVVCPLRIAQAVFGPFLPPRIRTGDAAFDAQIGVFEPPAKPGAYRGSAPPGTLSWSKPDVLAALRATGFVALQITDATVRIVTDERLGRARKAPLVHQLDVIDLARRLRAAVANPAAPRPALPSGPVSASSGRLEWIMSFGAVMVLTLVWLAPGMFGLGFLGCPDGGVYHHVIRPPRDVCLVAPTVMQPVNLGTLTAVVLSLAAAVGSLSMAVGALRRRGYLARIAASARRSTH